MHSTGFQDRVERVGLLAGPIVALLLFWFLPYAFNQGGEEVPFSNGGRATLALVAWMAIWWLTSATHVTVTALLPLALFPMLGILPMDQTAPCYADPMIYLFFGGFILAIAMSKHGLDRRIALNVLGLVGTRPAMMVAGVLGVTAFLSMWVSNTATAAMMLPIAASVAALAIVGKGHESTLDIHPEKQEKNLGICLMLSIAYGASIGGLGTPIGSPPNGVLLGFLRKELDVTISFGQWMLFGVPIALVMLTICWFMLTRVLFPVRREAVPGVADTISKMRSDLGPMKPGEWAVLATFVVAACAWMFQPLLIKITLPGGLKPFSGLTDPGVAMLAAMALFLTPLSIKKWTFAIHWRDAGKLPWDVLLLFGGGLALAAAIKANNVGDFLGSQVGALQGLPILLFIVMLVAITVLFSETASNTATATTLIPIFAGFAPELNIDPVELAVCCALAASCCFVLPVATPPNAIVMGSGLLDATHMRRAGVRMDVIGVGVIALAGYFLVPWVLGRALQ